MSSISSLLVMTRSKLHFFTKKTWCKLKRTQVKHQLNDIVHTRNLQTLKRFKDSKIHLINLSISSFFFICFLFCSLKLTSLRTTKYIFQIEWIRLFVHSFWTNISLVRSIVPLLICAFERCRWPVYSFQYCVASLSSSKPILLYFFFFVERYPNYHATNRTFT